MNLPEKYLEVRALSLQHCQPLMTEDYIPQPAEFVSPPKWHLAHTSWFFEEFLLKPYLPSYKLFHVDFGFLFNSYYNTVGSRVLRIDRGNMTRPSLKEVLAYREHIDQNMEWLFAQNIDKQIEGLVEIGLQHEQQHQELLLTDIKYILGSNPLYPVYREGASLTSGLSDSKGWIKMDEGVYEVGRDSQSESFGFDNESGRHKVYLNDFEINKALVTNGAYLEFIKDGGYERHELWLDEGWSWLQSSRIKMPMYWHHEDGSWWTFTLGGKLAMNPSAALSHVSHYEAAAFAEWKHCRLPTEFEWEAACDQFHWGMRWEHTNSAYLAYPGYVRPEGAFGEYNGKFMMNQMVLRGASSATSPGHSRNTYRNFFHPNMQWQFSGIRLAKNG